MQTENSTSLSIFQSQCCCLPDFSRAHVSKTTATLEEAKQLLEVGFECIADM